MRTLPFLCLLAACGGGDNKAPKESPPVADALKDECDPTIVAPSPPASSSVGLVTPHTETFGPSPEPFHVHLGWPSSDPSNSISFLWRTDVETLASVVEYGKDGVLDQRVEAASFAYGGAVAGEGPDRVHELKLCGDLEPNTTYTYRVGGEGHWSPEYTFTTPGVPGSFDTFTVGMIGDSRGAYEAWDDLLALMEQHSPDFYVFGGDFINIGPSQKEWDIWFDASGEVFANKVVVPAHGNHEFLTPLYFAQFSLPNNEQWFSARYGDLHLVSLNDTVSSPTDIAVGQVDYMNRVFPEIDSSWQMAVHHKAMYSASDNHGSALDVREAWEPVFDAHGIDAVIAGHNHVYERSVPIRGGQPTTAADGATYVVTGGAGAPLYNGFTDEWFTEVATAVEHYVIADFGPTGVTFTARDRSDNVVDQFTIPRRD